jgi:hypothetical protein
MEMFADLPDLHAGSDIEEQHLSVLVSHEC